MAVREFTTSRGRSFEYRPVPAPTVMAAAREEDPEQALQQVLLDSLIDPDTPFEDFIEYVVYVSNPFASGPNST